MTIGPHEGNELELMLAGHKKLAAFGDILPESGNLPEEIIPEQAFAPYVASRRFQRLEKIVFSAKTGKNIKYVCFAPPDEVWRAQAFLWIREMTHRNLMPGDAACDIIIGRLLGYSETDIQGFVAK